jgi:hypothetical protein
MLLNSRFLHYDEVLFWHFIRVFYIFDYLFSKRLQHERMCLFVPRIY